MGIIILIISPANSLTMLVFTVRKPSDGMVPVLNIEQKPSTNADFVPNEGRAVAAMLSASGLAGVENWTFADGFVERLRFEIDPAWHGELPLTILIGRDGTRTLMDGIADLERVRAWLENQNAQ